MRKSFIGMSLLALATSIVPGFARADQNLNCEEYAFQAVAQQKKNVADKCGLQGVGWSENYLEHLNWCRMDIVKMKNLTDAHNIRDSALKQCVANKGKLQDGPKLRPTVSPQLDITCGKYATLARKQNQENFKQQCGFKGGAWSDDVNGHRAWCLTASEADRTAQAQLRSNALLKCTTIKVFDNPKGGKVKGRRWPLDECESSLRLFCGTTQAESFCKQQGFKKVASFVKDSASSPPAKNRGTAAVVSSYLGNTKEYCGGRKCTFYKRITCKGLN